MAYPLFTASAISHGRKVPRSPRAPLASAKLNRKLCQFTMVWSSYVAVLPHIYLEGTTYTPNYTTLLPAGDNHQHLQKGLCAAGATLSQPGPPPRQPSISSSDANGESSARSPPVYSPLSRSSSVSPSPLPSSTQGPLHLSPSRALCLLSPQLPAACWCQLPRLSSHELQLTRVAKLPSSKPAATQDHETLDDV